MKKWRITLLHTLEEFEITYTVNAQTAARATRIAFAQLKEDYGEFHTPVWIDKFKVVSIIERSLTKRMDEE